MDNVQKRVVFKDPTLQSKFEENGYVVVPFITREKIEEGLKIYHSLNRGSCTGFWLSLQSENIDYRRQVASLLNNCFGHLTTQYLQDYKIILSNFMIKLPDGIDNLPLHQDWIFCDEHRYVSVNVWFPLVDITPQNGPFMILPKSNRYFKCLRGSGPIPAPFGRIDKVIREKYLTQVEIKAGEALIHDNSLIHYSPPNHSNEERVVACFTMIPQEAQPIHYYRDPQTAKVEKFTVDNDFFLTILRGKRPVGYPVAEVIENYLPKELTVKDLETYYPDKQIGLLQRLKKLLTKQYAKN